MGKIINSAIYDIININVVTYSFSVNNDTIEIGLPPANNCKG